MKIIANPTSRSGKGKRLWSVWQQGFKRQNVSVSWHVTRSGKDGETLACDADETIVAVGGDGTINRVINGCMQSHPPPVVGVLYAGTSPDFCKFHNIPVGAEAALQTLLAGETRLIDVVQSQLHDATGAEQKRYFACSSNIGLGACVARFANFWRKYLGDTIGTGLGLVLAMLTHKPFESVVEVDGVYHTFHRTNHIIILKNPHIASSLRIAVEATPDDGRLYAIVIHSRSGLGLLAMLRSMYDGSLLQKKNVFVQLCSRVTVHTTPQQEVEFDGDPQGYTPTTATLIPHILPLVSGRSVCTK